MPKNEKWLATAGAVTNHCAEILNEQSALAVAPRPGWTCSGQPAPAP